MGQQQPDTEREDQILLWQALVARRIQYDEMLWQTPALGMAAQAFLMTLALGADVSTLGRGIAALLGLILALLSMQLQVKHRYFEMLDSVTLEALEQRIGFRGMDDYIMHSPGSVYPEVARDKVDSGLKRVRRLGPKFFWRASSLSLWVYGQFCFAIISVLIIMVLLTGHSDWLSL